MTVRCSSCGVSLRVNRERLGGRTSAACPKCRTAIDLAQAADPPDPAGAADAITVVCSNCAAKLRAPAARAGSKSRCPRCRFEVVIGRAGAPAPAAPREEPEAAGVATRRIDSRTLGLEMGAMSAPPMAPEGVDLEEFIKGPPPGGPAAMGPGKAEGIAAALMNPKVGAMAEAAERIRVAAQELAQPAPGRTAAPRGLKEGAGPAKPSPASPQAIALATPAAAEGSSPARAPRQGSTVPASRDADRPSPFPMSRGILAGAAGGLTACGVVLLLQPWLEAQGLAWLLAPLPPSAGGIGVPAAGVRAILLGLLAALAGLVAAGVGSPSSQDRPLRIVRCAAMGALTGAAAGILVSLDPATASTRFSMWPVVNWLRDLLLAGLLTPALNRLLPTRGA